MHPKDSFDQIGAVLKGARSIAVACHVRPDGDAIGSIVSLASSLRLAGKTVHILSEDSVPENLTFLPGSDQVKQSDGKPLDIDVAVALDTATKERLGERTLQCFSQAGTLVDIDHHGTNIGYGQLNHIDVASPATGQIVYEFLSQQGLPIDDTIRQNLFAAISTDTGSFQFPSTTARTHQIIAEMMEAGLDTATLAQKLYHEHPMRHMLLLRALLNEMKVSAGGRIASWSLTQATQKAVDMLPGDTEGLIDTLRTIEGVISAVIFEELAGGKVRVSARSKDVRLNVSKVCAQFGGGGHALAAGARLPGPIAEAERVFLEALTNEISGIG